MVNKLGRIWDLFNSCFIVSHCDTIRHMATTTPTPSKLGSILTIIETIAAEAGQIVDTVDPGVAGDVQLGEQLLGILLGTISALVPHAQSLATPKQ